MREEETFVDSRSIPMPNGFSLDIQMTEEFVNRIMAHFSLDAASELSDELIKTYVLSVMDTAVSKEELKQLVG